MPHLSPLAALAVFVLAPGVRAGDAAAYPSVPSRKGLQVQMVDDALALGVAHAALNVNLAQLYTRENDAAAVAFQHLGRTWHFDRSYLEALDRDVRPLSERGVLVSLILLSIASGDGEKDAFLLDSRREAKPPHGICAPNLAASESRAWHAAALACMARRWSGRSPHGSVWGWIVGNEVNSHHWWFHMGPASLDEVVLAYEDFVRLVHAAVTSERSQARVYVSLEHHWSIRYPAGSELQAFAGRDFLLRFAARARARGDFPWHVAFHPYPEDLFDCAFWDDASAPDADGAARVTFRNLPVLTRFLERPELLHAGTSRRVILSEQGFHRAEGETGEKLQAAAYAIAWHAVQLEPTIDAFLLSRHVDHAHEGGLRLGLWTRSSDSICSPERRTALYEMFGATGTPGEAAAHASALGVLGIADWKELPHRLGHAGSSKRTDAAR